MRLLLLKKLLVKMKVFVKTKFSKIDFLGIRLGGPGLGNLLFPWARAVVFAKKNNLELLNPTWNTFKLGTFIRRERDKRMYRRIFLDSGIKGFKKHVIECFSKKINATQLVNVKSSYPTILQFEGMQNQMDDIKDDYALVKDELLNIVNPKFVQLSIKNKPKQVAIHIRLGDFQTTDSEDDLRAGKTNTRVPLKWYVNTIKKLQQQHKQSLSFTVFSDGSKEELKEVLVLDNVELMEGGNAISDLLSLSYAPILIASNSTFSLWSSYLGRCKTIWFPGTMRYKLFENSKDSLEFELDYDDDLPQTLLND